jgi:hypothetical protein
MDIDAIAICMHDFAVAATSDEEVVRAGWQVATAGWEMATAGWSCRTRARRRKEAVAARP